MKRHFFAALLLFILAGCAIDDTYQAIRTEEKQITIKAIREDDAPETRTMRDEDGKVYWCKGDQISLFYGSGTNGGSVFTSTQEEDLVKVTNFVGTITAITGGGEVSVNDTYFWGLYPYNENATCDGTSITTTLSSHQVAYPGSYANGTNISVGRSQGLIMGFYNACGGFRFSLNKEGVKKVTFRGRNGEDLAGELRVSFVNGKVKTEILEGESEVILEAPAGEYFEPGELYYIVLAPAVLSSGFTVTAETFTEEATFTYDSSITIESSNFKSKKQMDTGLTWTKKTGNIPIEDANFKAYLVENYDGNGDGEISYEEAGAITSINVCTDNIQSVQGIEYMGNLSSLECAASTNSINPYFERLLFIDISNNKKLTRLNCGFNPISALDVSNNTNLSYLDCSGTLIPTLDVSNNLVLTELRCSHNSQLTSIDVSKNTMLLNLYCSNLTTLDISNNTALLKLFCASGQLESLDVSKNTALKQLSCTSNRITSLDISNNSSLLYLDCSWNQLSNLDVTSNIELKWLSCASNPLTCLDITHNSSLIEICCFNNQLSYLDLTRNLSLEYLDCSYNQITNLDITNNADLTEIWCDNNLLTSLDLSKNAALVSLYCNDNQISSLDLSKNINLNTLDCSPMKDSNGSNLLETLYISRGQEIPNITTNRNDNYIPAETQIIVQNSPILPDDFSEDNYLLYRANQTVFDIGRDYYRIQSYMPGISGAKVEIKFQMNEGLNKMIACDNSASDYPNSLKIENNNLIWIDWPIHNDNADCFEFEVPLNSLSLNENALMVLFYDSVSSSFSINDNSFLCAGGEMSFSCLFASYGSENDEGRWTVYKGVPDNSKLYYVKTWDENNNLTYLGYATKALNPETTIEEYCWCNYYPNTGEISYTFANDAVNQGGFDGYTYTN